MIHFQKELVGHSRLNASYHDISALSELSVFQDFKQKFDFTKMENLSILKSYLRWMGILQFKNTIDLFGGRFRILPKNFHIFRLKPKIVSVILNFILITINLTYLPSVICYLIFDANTFREYTTGVFFLQCSIFFNSWYLFILWQKNQYFTLLNNLDNIIQTSKK